mmetsp:Transcript_23587/g.65423  ORF Transcript_23587/g.65423 Transcript_23587/m.65423 type:complete len:201 (-) Transcript_23587:77-679(-)
MTQAAGSQSHLLGREGRRHYVVHQLLKGSFIHMAHIVVLRTAIVHEPLVVDGVLNGDAAVGVAVQHRLGQVQAGFRLVVPCRAPHHGAREHCSLDLVGGDPGVRLKVKPRKLPGDEAVQHDPGAPGVGLQAVVAEEHLGSKVCRGACPLDKPVSGPKHLGASKVDSLQGQLTVVSVFAEHEVCRLHVSEADAIGVAVAEE